MYNNTIIGGVLVMANTSTSSKSLVDYGVMGICLLALGGFTLWQEKQRNARDDKARKQSEDSFQSVIELLDKKNQAYEDLVSKMLESNKK